ncbi:hypothetical protein BKA80DRAFT_275119 [Phyllosticta citrichinensis]
MRHDDGVEAWIASTATGEKNTEYKFLSPEPGRRECYIKGRPHDEFKVVVVVLRGFKFHTAAMVQQEIEIDGHWRFSTPRYVIKGQLNTAEHGIYITEYREDFQPLFPVEGSLVTKLRFGQLVCEESEESEEWIADSVLREHCLSEIRITCQRKARLNRSCYCACAWPGFGPPSLKIERRSRSDIGPSLYTVAKYEIEGDDKAWTCDFDDDSVDHPA